MPGLLGIDAPAAANLNLAAQILMGLALLAGMFLARRKRFRAHAACQSAVVLLNLIPISLHMLPVFARGVAPGLPGGLNDSFYALSTAHAAAGSIAELLGLYIILRAGTNLLPEALRFKNYKPWMRTELALWWLVIALGVGTYLCWYGGGRAGEGPQAAATPAQAASPQSVTGAQATPAAATAEVTVGNYTFTPKELTIEEGTTVVWKDEKGRHTIVADDGSFKSEVLPPDGEFRRTFERAGSYPYFCSLHGEAGGKDMAGTVTVTPRRTRPSP